MPKNQDDGVHIPTSTLCLFCSTVTAAPTSQEVAMTMCIRSVHSLASTTATLPPFAGARDGRCTGLVCGRGPTEGRLCIAQAFARLALPVQQRREDGTVFV